jgi:hypothetical protein
VPNGHDTFLIGIPDHAEAGESPPTVEKMAEPLVFLDVAVLKVRRWEDPASGLH